MKIDNDKYEGWSLVVVEKLTAWRLHTFLSLADHLFDKIKKNYETTHRRIVFDFSALLGLDSMLISIVLRTIRLTGTEKNSVIVPNEKTADMLHVLGIDRLVDVYESEAMWAAAHAVR